jgi:hypothetical protein
LLPVNLSFSQLFKGFVMLDVSSSVILPLVFCVLFNLLDLSFMQFYSSLKDALRKQLHIAHVFLLITAADVPYHVHDVVKHSLFSNLYLLFFVSVFYCC